MQSGTISFSKFTFHFNSSPTISLLARLHRYKSLIIQTYELNSKQKHKFLVTHLISTPHKLFHISRECILEVSTRLHKISQCPEGNFTRLGPFSCWKCLIKTDVVRSFSGHREIYRSPPVDTSTVCPRECIWMGIPSKNVSDQTFPSSFLYPNFTFSGSEIQNDIQREPFTLCIDANELSKTNLCR